MQTDTALTSTDFAHVAALCKIAINRVGYVLYQSAQAIQRNANFAVTGPTMFGNHGSLSASQNRSLNFAQDGRHILGSSFDASTRLAIEATFGFMNTLAASGIVLDESITSIMGRMHFKDELTSNYLPVGPPPFDPSYASDAEFTATMSAYFKHYYLRCDSVHLGLTKAMYRKVQDEVRRAEISGVASSTSRLELRPVLTHVEHGSGSPPHIIREVLSKTYGGGGKVSVYNRAIVAYADILFSHSGRLWWKMEKSSKYKMIITVPGQFYFSKICEPL